ncbi:hypothetical protein KC19_VG276600 [Ceratodon purpureus]|uniref:Uncharacterized protein n=1 Tax=Ceratodon purpureus TaxID=3225 RepID=A0A8T0HUU4_CERPU|nr:hypothetical protein KC19_VG276600 [Ceratodon purpureus]
MEHLGLMLPVEAILQSLLTQLSEGVNPWDLYNPGGEPWSPPVLCTIEDLENVRITCRQWQQIIGRSPEYAALRLARWDYDQERGPQWTTKREWEEFRFHQNWAYFGNSWGMAIPILDRRLRTDPLSALTCAELNYLRSLLWAQGNQKLWVEAREKLRPRDGMWIAEGDSA